jgi:hypothetical protein
MLTSTQSASSVDWEPLQHLSFLEGEEVYEEIGLDISLSLSPSPAYSDLSIQGGHPRTTE